MKIRNWAALCLLLAAGWAQAGDADVKARKQYMKEWRGLSKQMGSLLKQSSAQQFPAAEFAKLSEQLQQTAGEPWAHYGSDSRGGGSDAADAVWERPQDFQAAIKRFNDAAAALHRAAQAGSYAEVKTAFDQVGQSCKACHKTFKD